MEDGDAQALIYLPPLGRGGRGGARVGENALPANRRFVRSRKNPRASSTDSSRGARMTTLREAAYAQRPVILTGLLRKRCRARPEIPSSTTLGRPTALDRWIS